MRVSNFQYNHKKISQNWIMNAQVTTKDFGCKDGVQMISKIIPFRLSQETCMTNDYRHKHVKKKLVSQQTKKKSR